LTILSIAQIPEQLPMRVLVTGDKGFSNRRLLAEHLNRLHSERPFKTLIHCSSHEADRLASEWAVLAGITVRTYALEFARYGQSAFKVRNRQIIADKPDLVVSFQSGNAISHLLRHAKRANLEVLFVGHESSRLKET
jgi:hypothetical protein